LLIVFENILYFVALFALEGLCNKISVQIFIGPVLWLLGMVNGLLPSFHLPTNYFVLIAF
jgi:hypothetical protein